MEVCCTEISDISRSVPSGHFLKKFLFVRDLYFKRSNPDFPNLSGFADWWGKRGWFHISGRQARSRNSICVSIMHVHHCHCHKWSTGARAYLLLAQVGCASTRTHSPTVSVAQLQTLRGLLVDWSPEVGEPLSNP